MSTVRKKSSTKRENLSGYWIDADSYRLRGYPTGPTEDPAGNPSHDSELLPEAAKPARKPRRKKNESESLPDWIRAGTKNRDHRSAGLGVAT